MRKVKAYRWMRELTLRGMDWECSPTYRRGRGQETTIESSRVVHSFRLRRHSPLRSVIVAYIIGRVPLGHRRLYYWMGYARSSSPILLDGFCSVIVAYIIGWVLLGHRRLYYWTGFGSVRSGRRKYVRIFLRIV